MLRQIRRNMLDNTQRLRIIRFLDAGRGNTPGKTGIGFDITPPLPPPASGKNPHAAPGENAPQRVRALPLVAEQNMQIVDIEDHSRRFDFPHDRLQPLLKRSAHHGTRTQRRQIQRPDRGIVQSLRHRIRSLGDRVDKAERAGRLADARITDHGHRILPAAKQDGGNRLHLGVKTNGRINFPVPGLGNHVLAVARQFRKLLVGRGGNRATLGDR